MILLALAVLQDPEPLAWRFDAPVEIRWSSETKGPGLDLTVQIAGTLAVEQEGPSPRLVLRLRTVRMTGSVKGEAVDVRDDERLTQPIRLRGTPLGRFVPEGEHPLREALAGRGVFLGPELPEKAVRAGDTWRAPMQSGQAPELEAGFTVASREGRVLRVTADERPVAGTRLQVDGLFDAAAGRWTRVTTTAESGDTRSVIRLEVASSR